MYFNVLQTLNSNALMTLIDLEIQNSMPNLKYEKCRKLVTVYCKVFKSKTKKRMIVYKEIKTFCTSKGVCQKVFIWFLIDGL